MWRKWRRALHVRVIAMRRGDFLLGLGPFNALLEGFMYKALKVKAAIGAAAGVLWASTAFAQAANSQLMGGGLKDSFSASDVISILSEFPLESALQPYEGDNTATVLASTPGGARFLISLFQCEEPQTGAGCSGAAIFTGFSNAGVTYDELNDFNSDANVTRVVNVSDQNIIIFGTQLFFNGGISRANFKFVTELFLSDMQNYVETKSEAGTSVSLKTAPAERGKIGNLTSSAEAPALPPFLRTGLQVDDALDAAISNTWDVRFSVED